LSKVRGSQGERPPRRHANGPEAPLAPGRRGTNPFWRWSLRVYRSPGVQEACLALQDRCGADVNLLLFCGWIGIAGRALDKRRLRQAIDSVGRWQAEVITPLRAVRRTLKQGGLPGAGTPSVMALRRRIVALELELECHEQTLLYRLADTWPVPARAKGPPAAVAQGLARYLATLPRAPSPHDAQHLARLADACCATPR